MNRSWIGLSAGFLAIVPAMACGSSQPDGAPPGAQSGLDSGQASSSGGSSSGGSSSGGSSSGSSSGASSGGASSGGRSSSGSGSSGGGSSGSTSGGSSGSGKDGGSSPSEGGAADASGTGAPLPALTVHGNKLQDPSGKTIILRGSALIDIGSLYAYGGQSAAGITDRLDKVAAAGVQGHVVRMPVYPKITYNGTRPTCSPLAYPVGSGPSASCTPKTPLSASDYVSKVLKPAVDYATSKSLYVIIDFHQIDNATSGTSAADATSFWTDIAPQFATYPNVLFEPFNEPIDTMVPWATLKPVVQGWIDIIRAAAPNNVIVVPSNSWDQHPGDAAGNPPRGTNFVFTAHIYPSNWSTAFQTQVATAVAQAPVFVSEWGYNPTDPNPHAWGLSLQSTLDGNGASWTAWVTDNAWAPSMFADSALTQLTDFGTLVQSWLATKANSDWVQ